MHFYKKKNIFLPQLQNDDVNGSNLMDMMHDEAMLEQLAAAKSFPRKMMNNLDVANLLKQVQNGAAAVAQHQQLQQQLHHKIPSPSSTHSISPTRSASPNIAQHMLLTPVASTSSVNDLNK